jgi:hypothetical protein
MTAVAAARAAAERAGGDEDAISMHRGLDDSDKPHLFSKSTSSTFSRYFYFSIWLFIFLANFMRSVTLCLYLWNMIDGSHKEEIKTFFNNYTN